MNRIIKINKNTSKREAIDVFVVNIPRLEASHAEVHEQVTQTDAAVQLALSGRGLGFQVVLYSSEVVNCLSRCGIGAVHVVELFYFSFLFLYYQCRLNLYCLAFDLRLIPEFFAFNYR